jgi:GGDEF domain-containing protein
MVAGWLALVLAIPMAFVSGLLVSLEPTSAAEREEEHRLSGEFLDRQVRHSRKLSILDSQTALLQRWYFELRLAEEGRRCIRYGHSTGVIFMEVDAVTPDETPWTPSHEIDFVQLFARTLRSVDLAGRINEREYAVCLPHTTLEGAHRAVARLLENASGYQVAAYVALCPRDGTDFDALIEQAQPFDPEAVIAPQPAEAAASESVSLVQMLGTLPSGEIEVLDGQTVSSTKAKVRRASKRADVEVRIWEEDGTIHFERLNAWHEEGAV